MTSSSASLRVRTPPPPWAGIEFSRGRRDHRFKSHSCISGYRLTESKERMFGRTSSLCFIACNMSGKFIKLQADRGAAFRAFDMTACLGRAARKHPAVKRRMRSTCLLTAGQDVRVINTGHHFHFQRQAVSRRPGTPVCGKTFGVWVFFRLEWFREYGLRQEALEDAVLGLFLRQAQSLQL